MSRMSEMSQAMQDHCNTNYGPEDIPVLDREIWVSCNLCLGEGGWEEGRPQHDDPYFAVSIKCPSCNGTGWECE